MKRVLTPCEMTNLLVSLSNITAQVILRCLAVRQKPKIGGASKNGLCLQLFNLLNFSPEDGSRLMFVTNISASYCWINVEVLC